MKIKLMTMKRIFVIGLYISLWLLIAPTAAFSQGALAAQSRLEVMENLKQFGEIKVLKEKEVFKQ